MRHYRHSSDTIHGQSLESTVPETELRFHRRQETFQYCFECTIISSRGSNMDGSPDSTSSIRRRIFKDERDASGATASSVARDDSVDSLSNETRWKRFATGHLLIVQLFLGAIVLGAVVWAPRSSRSIVENEPAYPRLNLRSKGSHVASPQPQCKLRGLFLFQSA